VRPVAVAGTTVARASLHNADIIAQRDIRIGDTVVLQKAGDIIPEIVSVIKELRPKESIEWKFPTHSSLCGGDGRIERVEGMSAYRCVDTNSYELQVRKLAHFTSRGALDIDGLGEKTVELLVKHNLVATPNDFFDLTKDELVALPTIQEKSADNILSALATAKKQTLTRFLVALSIEHVGEETAELLASHFTTIENVMKASEQELIAMYGVGEVVAQSIVRFFTQEDNLHMVHALLTHISVERYKDKRESTVLDGQSVVVTGTFDEYSREDIESLVKTNGGKNSSSVSSKTSFVIAGESAGSKLQKARELSVPVLTLEEFLKRLKK